MANYKISGSVTDNCTIFIVKQDGTTLGKKTGITPGNYEAVFALESSTNVDVFCKNSAGVIVGYGDITPVSTEDSFNITTFSNSPISKIQNMVIDKDSDSTSYTWDITIPQSVDLSKSLFFNNGPVNADAHYRCLTIEPLSSTSFRLERYGVGAGVIANITIIEYASGSVQRGLYTLPSANNGTIAISSVDLSKSFVSLSGYQRINSAGINRPSLYFDSSAALKWYQTGYPNIIKLGWQVISF